MHAMPVMIVVLCCLAIAYRYYSAFLAARVAALDDSRATPANTLNDGQNFHPTNKWVLFGHHFAAISGAGPLIGPVLAAQFGYLPGLIWIVIGVCLAGAVQDFLVLAASMRRNGSSLAQIAFKDIGRVAGTASTLAILFIIVIALAGLGKVVVKALGGETVSYAGSRLVVVDKVPPQDASGIYRIPPGSRLQTGDGQPLMTFNEGFELRTSIRPQEWWSRYSGPAEYSTLLPKGSVRLVPGSSWGTFTIACTIPIALLVGLYMYKIRPGHVVEASIIGGVLTLGATVLGGYVANSSIAHWFNLSGNGVTWSIAIYGFVASVLPVWILLCPRDYLSSFLKIGTIALLVVGTIIANPKLEAPAINHAFLAGGPVIGATAKIFPFLFIVVMCGAISGFHALVSSGTTPKMIKKESDARMIGYGAMLIEGLVGVVAMIAAATLPMGDYFAMNTALENVPKFHDQFVNIGANIDHLNVYESLTQESLRGRTGGAVTLAVGFAHIFDGTLQRFVSAGSNAVSAMWKYWYHFAIMFEALFILTTIDTGTRIGRFLLQEVAGYAHPKLGIRGGMISAIVSTFLIVLGWAWFMNAGPFDVIWRMFGIANQMLAVMALAIVSAYLANVGKRKYLWVTMLPMLAVLTTTTSGAIEMSLIQINTISAQLAKAAGTRDAIVIGNATLLLSLVVLMLVCGIIIVLASANRIWRSPDRDDSQPSRPDVLQPAVIGK